MIGDANISPFVQIGQIARSQGLNGELKVLFESGLIESIEQLNMVYVRTDRGDFYPCRIANLRVEGKGNKISFFVHFEHIADRTAAESLKNKALFLDRETANLLFNDEANITDLIDYEVLNEQQKSVGLVVDYMDSGAQIVLTIATTSGSLLVPFVDEFVVEVNDETKTIYCKNLSILEGL